MTNDSKKDSFWAFSLQEAIGAAQADLEKGLTEEEALHRMKRVNAIRLN